MNTVTVCGASFQCEWALKGPDYVRLLDSSGKCVAAFEGVNDFSIFSISGTGWTTPMSTDDCHVAVMHEDGSVSGCGKPIGQFMVAGTPIKGNMILSSNEQFGTALPTTGVPGQLFFKIN